MSCSHREGEIDLIGKEASLEQFALDRQKLKAQLVNDLALIKQSNITAESKLEESELRRIQHQTDLAALANRAGIQSRSDESL